MAADVGRGVHDGTEVVGNVVRVEVVEGVLGEVEALVFVDVFQLDVDERVAIGPTHFVQQAQRRRDRVEEGLALKSHVQS